MFINHTASPRPFFWLLLVYCVASNSACTPDEQTADDTWSPTVTNPEFPKGDGPVVLVDAAHGNFHTIDGRYSAFAELLELDGYRVQSADSIVTSKLLNGARVYVISNAIHGGEGAGGAGGAIRFGGRGALSVAENSLGSR